MGWALFPVLNLQKRGCTAFTLGTVGGTTGTRPLPANHSLQDFSNSPSGEISNVFHENVVNFLRIFRFYQPTMLRDAVCSTSHKVRLLTHCGLMRQPKISLRSCLFTVIDVRYTTCSETSRSTIPIPEVSNDSLVGGREAL